MIRVKINLMQDAVNQMLSGEPVLLSLGEGHLELVIQADAEVVAQYRSALLAYMPVTTDTIQ